MRRSILLAAVPAILVTAIAITVSQGRPAIQGEATPAYPVASLQPGGPGGGLGGGPDGDRPPRGDDRDDHGPPRDGRDGGGGGPGGMGVGGMGPGGPPGGFRRMPPSADVMRNYLELVTRYAEMSKDPTTAGVAAVITTADLLRSKGNETAIAYFEKTLPEVQDVGVGRAIRLQLVELYKAANQTEKALEQLHIVMTQPELMVLHGQTPSTQPEK